MSPDAKVIRVYEQPQEVQEAKKKQMVRIVDESPKESYGIGSYFKERLKEKAVSFGKKWGKKLIRVGLGAGALLVAHYVGKKTSKVYRSIADNVIDPALEMAIKHPLGALKFLWTMSRMSTTSRLLVGAAFAAHLTLKNQSTDLLTAATTAPTGLRGPSERVCRTCCY